jgi:hypothetical protein
MASQGGKRMDGWMDGWIRVKMHVAILFSFQMALLFSFSFFSLLGFQEN